MAQLLYYCVQQCEVNFINARQTEPCHYITNKSDLPRLLTKFKPLKILHQMPSILVEKGVKNTVICG